MANIYLSAEKKKIKKSIRLSTYQTYEIRNSNIIRFLKTTGKEDIKLDEIDGKLLDQLKRHLLDERGVSNDHARRVISQLKQVINYAYLYEYTDKNTIQGFKVERSSQKDLIYLEEHELDRLMHYPIASPKLRQAADLFKFQCWTGLSYADLVRFNIENLDRDKDGDWISYTRNKNGKSEAILPLLHEAEEILKQYNYQLPFFLYNKYRIYLKEVADIVGIQKNITTHVGRKTFGMIMLNSGVALEVVSKMLGHKSVKTTQDVYAKVLRKRVAKDMNKYFPERPLNTGKLIILR